MARPREFDIDQALDRATELFWTRGYDETSMRELEEGLGVGRQSLYSTFGDKRDLFLAALDRYATQQRKQLAPLHEADAGLASIRRHFSDMVEFAIGTEPRRSCLMLNSVVEFGQADADITRRCTVNQERLAAAFRHALEGAAKRGELSPGADPAALALFLVSQAYGLVVMARAGASRQTLSRVVATALSALGP